MLRLCFLLVVALLVGLSGAIYYIDDTNVTIQYSGKVIHNNLSNGPGFDLSYAYNHTVSVSHYLIFVFLKLTQVL
jgi:hypothetical protein